MKKFALLISDGSEEIEALTPVDILRRAGIVCDVFSVCKEFIKGSHGIVIKADKLINELCIEEYDGLIIPGGMPGAKIIADNITAKNAINVAVQGGKLVAAICASPAVVLAENGFLKCKKATCYPAENFVFALKEKYVEKDVVVDGNFITANGPKSAMSFSFAICDYFNLTPKF